MCENKRWNKCDDAVSIIRGESARRRQHGVRSEFGHSHVPGVLTVSPRGAAPRVGHRSGMLSSASISYISANKVEARKIRLVECFPPIGDRNTRTF